MSEIDLTGTPRRIRITYIGNHSMHAHPTASYDMTMSQPFVAQFTQSVAATDAATLHVRPAYSDSVVASDTINYFFGGKYVVEAVSPSDVFDRVWLVERAPTDSVTPSEVMVRSTTKVLTDSVTPSEVQVFAVSGVYADSVTPSESVAGAVGKVLADSATPSEAMAKSLSKVLSDSVTMGDGVTRSSSVVDHALNGSVFNSAGLN